jgi:DNA-binding transcriptional ArsR family regulator
MAAYAPYKYNPAEMPPDDIEKTFVGRGHLLDRLLAAIREQPENETVQHYLLLGPRGIGKTTMLLMIQKRLSEDPELSGQWLCVRFREEEFYVHTLRDLLALAVDSLHSEQNIPEASPIHEAAEATESDEESLAILLSGLRRISETHKKRILLLIDNFDEVFPKRVEPISGQNALRKLLSAESFVMVIGTSVQLFEDIAGYDEAFFNFFSPVYLENLCESEIEELLAARAEIYHNGDFLQIYQENKDKFRAISFLTGGNPRLVLMLYDILSQKRFLPVVEALRETVDRLTPLLKDILGDMPAQQSKILDALMRLGGVASPSEVARLARLSLNAVTTQLGRLKEARIVAATGDGRGKPSTYRVRDQMFRTWYQMRYLRPARRRIEMFVEFLRSWFSVEDRLESMGDLRREFDTCLSSGETGLTEESRRNTEPGIDDWMNRLCELELDGIQVEQRLEGRIEIVAAVARKCSLDAASRVLDTLLETETPEIRERIEFLRPALDFARTGEESVLARLPQEEQEIARRIAEKMEVPDKER